MTSRLRFAILLAASSLGVLLVAASGSSSSSRPPEVHIVGDETQAPAGNDDGTQQTTLSEQWAMKQRFYVGDVLDFKVSNEWLLLVRQGDYERCSAASPLASWFANGRDTRFTLEGPGLFYFISGVPASCEAGERMIVRVVDPLNNISGAPTPTPAPAPAPGPEPDATVSGRHRRALTVAEMQMVAGAIGFAAGFVTTLLSVALFICCCP